MTDLPLIFVGGLLGSSHCLGMCGPLALALGANQSGFTTNLSRQLVFSAGRILTYGFGGATAAFTGWWLAQRPAPVAFINMQALLSIVAGLLLVLFGLAAAGKLPPLAGRWLSTHPCGAAKWIKTLLTGRDLTSALLAGVFTGFIPCGLVYAFLAYAATAGDVLRGWLTMVAFGLGTVPMMVFAGCGGTLISHTARARILRVAAWCVVVTGLISIARGAGYIEAFGHAPTGCPMCP